MNALRSVSLDEYHDVRGVPALVDPWIEKQGLKDMLIVKVSETEDPSELLIMYVQRGWDKKIVQGENGAFVYSQERITPTKPFPWEKLALLRRYHHGEEVRSGIKDAVAVILNGGNPFA